MIHRSFLKQIIRAYCNSSHLKAFFISEKALIFLTSRELLYSDCYVFVSGCF